MAKIIIPNCVEVRLHWTFGSALGFNVLHAQYTLAGPLNPTVGESLFAAIKAAAGTTTWFTTHLAQSVHFTALGVRDLRTADNPELLSSGATLSGGDATSAAMPNSVAIVVTLRTDKAGREFRGRVYLSGMTSGANSTATGLIQDTANIAAIGFVQAIKTALSAQSMTLAIGQKELPARTNHAGETLPLRPANVIPVTQLVTVDNLYDSQRRRKA